MLKHKQEHKEVLGKKHEMAELVQKYGTKMAHLIKLLGQLLEKKTNRIIIFSQWDGMLHKVLIQSSFPNLHVPFLHTFILFSMCQVGDTLKENGINNVFVRGNVWQARP